MATTTKNVEPPSLYSLPNQLTVSRLLLSIVLFVLIDWQFYGASLFVFLLAASTDWLDGYLARRWGLVTVFGRILDPLVDKIIICGTFIYLAAITGSGIAAWMAVIVVGRELLVTALRSFLEQLGGDFSARMAGKLKMVFQCIAAGLSLLLLSLGVDEAPSGLAAAVTGSAWIAVALTVYSGVEYIRRAVSLSRDLPT